MSWSVEYTNEFGDWWATLPETAQNDVAAAVGLLGERGPDLAPPYARDMRDSRHRRMRELRAPSEGAPIRVLHAFGPRDTAILLIGDAENGDERFVRGLLRWADDLYDRHLEELRKEGSER